MKLFRLGSNKCFVIGAFSPFPSLFSLEPSTAPFVPGNSGHHFSFAPKRYFFAYVAASLSLYQLRQILFALPTTLYYYQITPNIRMGSRGERTLEFVILLPVLSRDWISSSLYFLIIFSFVSELKNENEIEWKIHTGFLIVLSSIMLQSLHLLHQELCRAFEIFEKWTDFQTMYFKRQ